MLIIRKASLNDYEAITAITKKSTTEEEVIGFVPPEGVSTNFLRELNDELKRSGHGVIIAEKHGHPVGFAYFRFCRDFAEIEEVDVIKEYQGQGVGKALVQHVENAARKRGLKHLDTGTSMNKEGKQWKAYGFWVHLGFADTGERIDGPHGLKYAKLVKQLLTQE
jgi:GNAT superfamily N-acetyltransferase